MDAITISRDDIESAGGDFVGISKLSSKDLAIMLAVAFHAHNAQTINGKYAEMRQNLPPTGEDMPPALFRERTSATLGQIGESTVFAILSGKFTCNMVATTARSGDLRIFRDKLNPILVEVKKYSTPVGPAEIDKFYRDLDAHCEIRGGLFLSLDSRITGYHEDYSIGATADGRPTIVASTCKPELIITLALLLDQMIVHGDKRRLETRSISTKHYAQLSAGVHNIQQLIGGISSSRVLVGELQNSVDKQCWGITKVILSTETQIMQQLGEIVAIMQQESVSPSTTITNISAVLDALPPGQHTQEPYKSALIVILHAMMRGSVQLAVGTGGGQLTRIWHDQTTVLNISALKTRTKLSVQLLEEQTVPKWANYADGAITVSLDRQFISVHLCEFCQLLAAAN